MNHLGWERIWNSEHTPEHFESLAPPENRVVEWADSLPPGISILDVGCGVGRHVVYLGGRGFRMSGSDIAPSGVARARIACTGRKIPFDGQVCAMTAQPWPDATFDAALSTSTIHHGLRAEIQESLDEIWRLLNPGGAFLVDFPCTDTWDYRHFREGVAKGEIVEVEMNTFVDERTEPEDLDGYLPHHYCDEADARNLLHRFTVERLWAALRPTPPEFGDGQVGKWVGWVHKPMDAAW